MKRVVLLYGLSGGVLIAALNLAQYRFLVVERVTIISAAVLRKKRPDVVSGRSSAVL